MAQHCWHDTRMRLMVNPPIMVYVCCHCNAEGRRRQRNEKPEGHGPYAPEVTVQMLDVKAVGSEECPDKANA